MQKNRRTVKPNKRRGRLAITNEQVEAALRESGGIQARAAKLLNRSRARVGQIVAADPHLQQVIDSESEEIFSLAKEGLKHLVKKKNVIACIYCCKVLGKPLWSERIESFGAHMDLTPREGSGVLLLPTPSPSLRSWEKQVKEWERQKQIECEDGEYTEEDEDY